MDEQCLNSSVANQVKQVKEITDRHTDDIRKIFEDIKDIEVNAGRKAEKIDNTTELLRQINDSLRSIEKKLDAQINKINDDIKVELEKRDARITALEMIPVKKWNGLNRQLITSLVTTVIGFIAGKFLN